jgi:hypothetical protein
MRARVHPAPTVQHAAEIVRQIGEEALVLRWFIS